MLLVHIQQTPEAPVRLNLSFTGAQALAALLTDSPELDAMLTAYETAHSHRKAADARELFGRLRAGILEATTVLDESRPFEIDFRGV